LIQFWTIGLTTAGEFVEHDVKTSTKTTIRLIADIFFIKPSHILEKYTACKSEVKLIYIIVLAYDLA
jgi:hypothetical protein